MAELALPVEWRVALCKIVEPIHSLDASAREQLRSEILRCVEQLRATEVQQHEAAMEAQRARVQWQLAEAEKKLQSRRRAGSVEGEKLTAQLEASREAIARLQVEMDEAHAEHCRQLEAHEEIESSLRKTVTRLDGGMATASLERNEHIQMLQRKAIRRLNNVGISRAFDAWLSMCAERKHMEAVARRMLNSAIARCFLTWVVANEEQGRARRMLAGAASRLSRPALVASLSHWRQDWEAAKRFAEKGGLLGRIAALEEALRAAREDAARRATQSATDARQARAEQMAKAAVRRMLNQQMSQAWETWVEQCEEELRRKRMLSSFVTKLLNQGLSRAWESWVEDWQARARDNRMRAAFFGRLVNQHLARAWNAWVESGDDLMRKRRVMGTFVSRLMNKQLALSWGTWIEACEERARQREMMRGFVCRLMNLQLTRSWLAWLEHSEERERQRRILAHVASRLRNPSLVSSFRHWRSDWTTARLDVASSTLSAVDHLQQDLHVAQQTAMAAANEARVANETIARQEREVEALRRSMRTQLEESERRISEAQDRADTAISDCEKKLRATDVPLSVVEKQELVAALNVRLEQARSTRLRKLAEFSGLNHSGPIRLTELLNLRDPALSAISPRTRPLRQALLQLAITPSAPEDDAWAHHVTIADQIERTPADLLRKLRRPSHAPELPSLAGSYPNLHRTDGTGRLQNQKKSAPMTMRAVSSHGRGSGSSPALL